MNVKIKRTAMKKIFLPIAALLLLNTGCKKFIDINTDPNNPNEVTEKLLLSPQEYQVAHNIASGASGAGPTYVMDIMQVVALNQPVPNFGTYQFVPGNFDATWSSIYLTLQNLRILKERAEVNNSFNYSAIAKILTAYVLGVATDYWGDIPYTQSLKGVENFYPAYDKQEDIYKQIQSLLDDGITDIGKNSPIKPGTDDFFYAGDMNKWKRMAYILKARNYIHLTKKYGATTQADLVLTALQNGMTSNADDLKFSYPGTANAENRWNLNMRPVETLILASTIIDSLKAKNDPRISYLAAPAKTDGQYRGRQIGYTGALPNLNSFSVIGPAYGNANSPLYIITYSEALFLKAEATFYKSGAAAAQTFHRQGIRSHMQRLGIDTNSTAAQTYLNVRGVLTNSDALQKIIEEKTIANFLSIENFNDWRRTGFPILIKVPNAVSEIPRRFLYPQSELNTNPQPQQSATMTDKVWWDQ